MQTQRQHVIQGCNGKGSVLDVSSIKDGHTGLTGLPIQTCANDPKTIPIIGHGHHNVFLQNFCITGIKML